MHWNSFENFDAIAFGRQFWKYLELYLVYSFNYTIKTLSHVCRLIAYSKVYVHNIVLELLFREREQV